MTATEGHPTIVEPPTTWLEVPIDHYGETVTARLVVWRRTLGRGSPGVGPCRVPGEVSPIGLSIPLARASLISMPNPAAPDRSDWTIHDYRISAARLRNHQRAMAAAGWTYDAEAHRQYLDATYGPVA